MKCHDLSYMYPRISYIYHPLLLSFILKSLVLKDSIFHLFSYTPVFSHRPELVSRRYSDRTVLVHDTPEVPSHINFTHPTDNRPYRETKLEWWRVEVKRSSRTGRPDQRPMYCIRRRDPRHEFFRT